MKVGNKWNNSGNITIKTYKTHTHKAIRNFSF